MQNKNGVKAVPAPAGGVILGQRLAFVKFSPGYLFRAALADNTTFYTTKGVPADCQLVSMEFDKDHNVILVLTHPSFPMRGADGSITELLVEVAIIPVQAAPEPQPEQ